jgi:hypothetical protein
LTTRRPWLRRRRRPPAAHQVPRQRQRYFRIWIVNLLLTIATLGIYSAWAKVRRNQYVLLHRAGRRQLRIPRQAAGNFEGRIIALVLIGGYNLAFQFSPLAGVVMLLLLAAVMPFLVWNSLKFRLFYTSYRGIRFGFGGTLKAAYFHFLLLPILYALSLTLALPFVHQRIKRFQHTESRYGSQHFSFDATVGAFYQRYLILLGLMLAGGMVFGIAGAMMGAAFGTMGMLVAMGIVYLWFAADPGVHEYDPEPGVEPHPPRRAPLQLGHGVGQSGTAVGDQCWASSARWACSRRLPSCAGPATTWSRSRAAGRQPRRVCRRRGRCGVRHGVGATDMLDFDLSI